MRVVMFDIEATGLKADFGRILCACVKPLGESVVTFRCDKFPTYKDKPWCDGMMCEAIRNFLEEFDIIVTWYGKGFDIPFLNTRLVLHEVPTLKKMMHIDLYYQARSKMRFHSNRLDAVTKVLGTKHRKTPLTPEVWLKAAALNKAALEEIVDHCIHDVKALEDAYARLKPGIERITK